MCIRDSVLLHGAAHGLAAWARGPGSKAVRGTMEQNAIYHMIVQATPRLRQRLCDAGTCDAKGVPVELPKPTAFERQAGDSK